MPPRFYLSPHLAENIIEEQEDAQNIERKIQILELTHHHLDEQTGEVILKIANTSTEHTTAKINLQGKEIKDGKLIRLSAKNGLEENTIDNPTNIYPVENYVTTEKNGATVEIPASSLNIIRLK